MLLHVRDMSHGESEAQAEDVTQVLREIGIDPGQERRIIEVWNKVDLLSADERTRLAALAARREGNRPVLVSAVTGEGVDTLLATDRAAPCRRPAVLSRHSRARRRASLNWLYEQAEILERRTDQEGRTLASVRIAPEKEPRFLQRFPGARRLPSRV